MSLLHFNLRIQVYFPRKLCSRSQSISQLISFSPIWRILRLREFWLIRQTPNGAAVCWMLSAYDDVLFIYTLCRKLIYIAIRHHSTILIMDPIVCRFVFISTISRFYFMAFFLFATCLIPILGKPWRLALCSRNRAGLNTRKGAKKKGPYQCIQSKAIPSIISTNWQICREKKDAAKGLATITEMENGRCSPSFHLAVCVIWL